MADETDLTAAVTDLAEPDDCPCGHNLSGGEYMCINGLIYGPCPHPNCGGVCDDNAGYCTHPDCACSTDT